MRGSEDGRKIDGIDYEAHREMAEHQLQQIAEQAVIEFGLRSVIIHHRIGFVALGNRLSLREYAVDIAKQHFKPVDGSWKN